MAYESNYDLSTESDYDEPVPREDLIRHAGAAIAAGQRRDAAREQSFLDPVANVLSAVGYKETPRWSDPRLSEAIQARVPSTETGSGMIAPIGGAILGGILGAGVKGVGPQLGSAMGAAAGKGVNALARRLTTPPEERPPVTQELTGMAKEGAFTYLVPKALGGLGWLAGKTAGNFIPGSWRAKQMIAARDLPKVVEKIDAPTTKVAGKAIEEFVEHPESAQVLVPLQQTAEKVAKLERTGEEFAAVGKYFRDLKLEKLADAVENISTGVTGALKTLPIGEVQTLMRRLRDLSGSAPEHLQNSMRALRKSIEADVRALAEGGSVRAQELLGLRKTYARAALKKDIGEYVAEKGIGAAPESAASATQRIAYPGKVHKEIFGGGAEALETDLAERAAKLLTPAEAKAVGAYVDKMSRYARPTGEGWGRFAHPLAWWLGSMGAAGAVGGALGGWKGAGEGAMAGALLGVAGSRGIERLLRRPAVRKLVMDMLENKVGEGVVLRRFAPPLAAALGAAAGEGDNAGP